MNELWYCLNCWYKGALNQHGNCARCDSKAVVSIEATYTMARSNVLLAQDASVGAQ